MDLAGDKKRIRALFSELSLEDQSVAPRFEELWHRGETTTPLRSLRPSLLLLFALALIAICSFALWTRYRSAQAPQAVISQKNNSTPTASHVQEEEKVVFASPRKAPRQSQKKLARRTRIQPSVQELAVLSNWQSPTGSFLQFAVSPVSKSLPHLNQSARELESFLSNNDVKELK
jgi:FtsZ-interacting cell division protein ZipA